MEIFLYILVFLLGALCGGMVMALASAAKDGDRMWQCTCGNPMIPGVHSATAPCAHDNVTCFCGHPNAEGFVHRYDGYPCFGDRG